MEKITANMRRLTVTAQPSGMTLSKADYEEDTLQMFAGIYGESTFRTCKNDRETLYRGKPQ